MKNEDNENTVYISAEEMEVIYDEEITEIAGPTTLWSNHGTKVLLPVKKGKLKGKEVFHFKCSYCREKHFQGPSTTAFLEHLRKVHPLKCSELLSNVNKPPKNFFSKSKKMVAFNEDVFIGKLLKWIIRTVNPFRWWIMRILKIY
jgi:hypothetical protein